MQLDWEVERVPGIGSLDARRLHRMAVRTVRDLLLFLPVRLEEFGGPAPISLLGVNAGATVIVTVVDIRRRFARTNGKPMIEAVFRDDEGATMRAAWFNQPYILNRLHPGSRVALAGKLKRSKFSRGVEMVNPSHELLGDGAGPSRVGGIVPRYQGTEGLKPGSVARWVKAVLPLADQLEDDIPAETRARHGLLPLAEAVRKAHQPESEAEWEAAQHRRDFAALLELQSAFQLARRRLAIERATPIPYSQDVIETFKAGLGFELTHAQKRATWDVFKDLRREIPMNRMLNGDVGSGKTAVAAAAAAMAHAAGLQTVVMAPTEILARQHLGKFRGYLEPSFPGLTVELLISGLPAAERRRVRTAAASGHCAVLVGTHALIEDDVELASLGLAVVDEQHRFGTRQRTLLREKSASRPHFLTMTATPIPRSLALALYGEMDLSIIDEMPPGRTPVETRVVTPAERDDAYELVRREVRAGRQVFVICPLIEESEKVVAKAATVEFERLSKEVFPDLRLGLVHGRLKEKDVVMQAFRDRQCDVLVATSVVEVGVDVPNATVMMVEGADRFGLAQLHQLRGRVGRGALRSYCLLLADDPSGEALQRLHLLAATNDGFELAQADMRKRGAGELLGTRQHGDTDAAMRALEHPVLLSEVRDEAERLLAEDPDQTRWPELWRAAERRLDQTAIS
jgi:ATP-dependent DNA helicase RecG